MPFVVLKATDTSNTYGRSKARINKQLYINCYIFRRYQHTPMERLYPEDITIYKEYKAGIGNAVVLKTIISNRPYRIAHLVKAHVYYNRYENKTPLLLVLFFDGHQNAINRYYVRSDFDEDIRRWIKKGIDTLRPLESDDIENEILQPLLKENDRISDLLTYQVDKTTSKDSETYNGNKIQIIKRENDPSPGFKKYTHIPVGKYAKHKACVLCNSQVLFYWNTSDRRGYSAQIREIQNIKICSISVYYSPKIKEPLIIDILMSDKDGDKHLYYFRKISNNTLYWQSLDSKTFNNFVNQRVKTEDVHTRLTETGNKLLKSCLEKIESNLTKILIIMVDRTSEYSKNQVGTLKGQVGNNLDYVLANAHGTVAVKEVSTEFNALSSKGYAVYEHDFTSVSKSLQPNEALKIKFIGSKTEMVTQHSTMVTLNLEYQLKGGGYRSQSLYISVITNTDRKNKFKWYKHNCDKNITDKAFRLGYNGQYATVEPDSSDYQLNYRVVLVYFAYDYLDAFIFVAFPSEKSNKIRILSYSKFKSNALTGTIIKMSELDQTESNTMASLPKGSVHHIDSSLLKKLQDEHEKLKSEISGSIEQLSYEINQNKFYVYLYGPYLQPLMICYNDKAYTRFYLSQNRSSWNLVTGISSCMCKNVDSQDTSETIFVKSLNEVATSLSLIHPKKPDKGKEVEEEEDDEEDPSKRPLVMDISKIKSADYDFDRITVTENQTYSKSNLFVYCTHTPKGEDPLTIDSLITSSPVNKTIKLEASTKAKYVTVYFNRFILTKPLVLCIGTDDGKEKYYKDVIKPGDSYSISQDASISSDNLLDKLIDENDKRNSTFTYQIDKTIFTDGKTSKYGNEESITVTKEEKSLGFTIYTHKPNKAQTKSSYILQNKNLLVGRLKTQIGDAEDSHGKSYSSVKVYSLTKEPDFLLLIEFNGLFTFYYSYKRDEKGLYWGKEGFNYKSDLSIKEKLDELNYPLKSSVIIEIDEGSRPEENEDTEYEMRLIENKLNPDGTYEKSMYIEGKPVEGAKKIKATHPSKMYEPNQWRESGYKYVSHELPDSGSLSSLGKTKANVAGVRLFITKTAVNKPEEIYLYQSNDDVRLPRKRLRLYYPPTTTSSSSSLNKVFVYFYKEDTRPLSICYNGKLYKSRDNKFTEWIYDKTAKCYQASEVLNTLKIVYQKMKRKITFSSSGKDKHIDTYLNKRYQNYMRDSYSADYRKSSDGPYVLSKATVTKGLSNVTILDKLLDTLDGHTFDMMYKYYKNSSTNPLVFEFADGSAKTYIVRKDRFKYWSMEKIGNLAAELSKIEKSINETTVYEIDKTSSTYNTNITVKKHDNQPTNGFNKYTHSPNPGHTSGKVVVLYNLAKLTKIDRGTPKTLTEIESKPYQSVTVYFGDKAKNESKPAPLVLELTTSGTDKKHYKHKLDKSVYNWEPLTIPSPDDNNKQLIEELKKTEFELVESVVVLLEKTDNEVYGDDEIQSAMRQHDPPKQFNLAGIDRRSIRVSDKTGSEAKCISDFGYKACEHDLSTCFKGSKNYGLRFFILANDSTYKYKEIKLSNSDESLDTLYYVNGASTGKDKVYVYFYSKDPRPLLACYNGIAYRPKSSKDYDKEWVRVNKITKCPSDEVSHSSELLKTLSDIAKTLNVVLLDKRPSVLKPENEKPDSPGIDNTKYSVQKFKNKDIDVKVTYRNKKCYRVYNHEPNGSDGRGDGYRLGEIKYGSDTGEAKLLNYTTHKPLSMVSTYYSLYDKDHKHPFLVVLKFKNGKNTEEYYKLKGKDVKEWVKMDEGGSDKDIINQLKKEDTFEDGLYSLRTRIGIDFENTENITPLFKADKCEEGSIDWVAIGAGSGGGIVGVGTIVTIGVVVVKKLAAAAGPGSALEFALKLVELLCGTEIKDSLGKAMLLHPSIESTAVMMESSGILTTEFRRTRRLSSLLKIEINTEEKGTKYL
ncbi:4-methyl-5(b-hydroxyethyl)-thiazol monophosphate biosynthesis enzyme [Theileria orientalis strain Shintoku]|uniref:4-methyl-5(B-hydroxyethyl)-thiazol monophosphate biosynthesis enzyme n=1 Tax=Theileria orientalis strain Shintoku TaxID=869250 RepID=J4D9N9_THEOR|nr:4-methyl-5(b-hydroxyethyl)-thiazol monophosphate biosynthesis enzyme [Theileria orientalis strain Shintoku]BAM41505.1 4-methyl-5(b-hydroxyethyl)-thiazol monophosphate biosynthesis enzyme [Theileria orientalis strain Shintoku]|eukprot:XP_009691806.1 4-methyl-5(b-hydroxyethyl)-thiazol monophosphate biosynthesis enzyme [Theileria orientalis strain Shintoku]